MSLTDKINKDIKAAMLAKESKKLEALRAVKAALLLAKKKKKSGGEVSEMAELQILQRLIKQRIESAELYKSQKRDDLAEAEEYQASIIKEYLPEQMDEEAIAKEVKVIIEETGATGMSDMGKVMGLAVKKLAGKADNKMISQVVRKLLA